MIFWWRGIENGLTSTRAAAANLHLFSCPTIVGFQRSMCGTDFKEKLKYHIQNLNKALVPREWWVQSFFHFFLKVRRPADFKDFFSEKLAFLSSLFSLKSAGLRTLRIFFRKTSLFVEFFFLKVRRPADFKDFFSEKLAFLSSFFSLKSAGLRTLRIFFPKN